MRAHDQGSIFRVTVSADEVAAFKSRWPASRLPSRGVSFTFEKRTGDLVDLSPRRLDGEAAAALSEDAKAYGIRALRIKDLAPARGNSPITKKEAREQGAEAGYSAVIYGEFPEGATAEQVESEAFEPQENARQFSPFEFLASEINESRDPDAVWSAYDDGVAAGIRKGVRERFARKGRGNPRGRYRVRRLLPASRLDPRSLRTARRGGRLLTVGCPRGRYSVRVGRCRVGTVVQRILTPKRNPRPAANRPGRAVPIGVVRRIQYQHTHNGKLGPYFHDFGTSARPVLYALPDGSLAIRGEGRK